MRRLLFCFDKIEEHNSLSVLDKIPITAYMCIYIILWFCEVSVKKYGNSHLISAATLSCFSFADHNKIKSTFIFLINNMIIILILIVCTKIELF